MSRGPLLPSVSGASAHDPLLALTCHGSDRFEVGVVVQHREISRLRDRSDERVDERERAVLASFGQELLDLERPLQITIGRRRGLVGVQPDHDRVVVGSAACAVAELEDDRGAEGHLARGDERCERAGDRRLRGAGEGARVGKERGAPHLVVPAPSSLGGVEVEPTFLAEEREEFEATLGVDHFDQGRVDGVPEGGRAEDGSGLRCDISIDFHGCLAHSSRISRVGVGATAIQRAGGVVGEEFGRRDGERRDELEGVGFVGDDVRRLVEDVVEDVRRNTTVQVERFGRRIVTRCTAAVDPPGIDAMSTISPPGTTGSTSHLRVRSGGRARMSPRSWAVCAGVGPGGTSPLSSAPTRAGTTPGGPLPFSLGIRRYLRAVPGAWRAV